MTEIITGTAVYNAENMMDAIEELNGGEPSEYDEVKGGVAICDDVCVMGDPYDDGDMYVVDTDSGYRSLRSMYDVYQQCVEKTYTPFERAVRSLKEDWETVAVTSTNEARVTLDVDELYNGTFKPDEFTITEIQKDHSTGKDIYVMLAYDDE